MTRTGPSIRLHVDDPLDVGAELSPVAGAAHYLLVVMRLESGAEVALFNGRDGEWRAELIRVGRKDARLRVLGRLRGQQAEPGPCLLFAPVKRANTDLIVEKATELGVSSIRPVISARSIAERVRTDRLRLIAREAAEQCGRLTLPDIHEPAPLIAAAAAAGSLLLCDTDPGAPALVPGGSASAVLIGPEGGFAPEERARLLALDTVRPVSLGPRILRAETAVIAALAILGAGQTRPR